jgi:hypothetical protein
MNKYRNPGSKNKHWAPKPEPSKVLFSLLANELRTKQGESRALVVKGQIFNPW